MDGAVFVRTGIPPRTNIAPYRGVRAWNGLDGPVPVRGTAQGTRVPVPSRFLPA